jgi:hypothetical protein
MRTSLAIEAAAGPAVSLTPVGDRLDFGSGPGRWIRAGTSFLAVLTAVLIGLQCLLVGWKLDDPDIWWHLRNAACLLKTHHLPSNDVYSFTVAGHFWVNHEWLSEIPFYFAYRALGFSGLKILTALIVSFLFLCVLYVCYQESRNFKASVAACCFATFLASVSYGPRTILFGYLYLMVLLIILQRFRNRGEAPLWAIPPLFCLWINTHGSWSLGMIVFALVIASGFIGGSWGKIDAVKWTRRQRQQLILTLAAAVVAVFVNPYGWRLVFYPLDLAFNQHLNITHVAEWVTVDFHTTRGKLVLLMMVGLLLAGLVRKTRWNLGELLVFLFALYSGLTYVRFLVLLGIVGAPVMAKALDFFPRYRPLEDTPKINAVVIFAIIAALIYWRPTNPRIEKSVEQSFPVEATAYIEAHPLNGNLLNFYFWGGYLGWSNPEIKVFVDSRVDIFEYEGVLRDYLSILMLHEPDSIIAKYRIRYVLFPPTEAYTYVLVHDSRWKVLYQDKVGVLLERREDRLFNSRSNSASLDQ